jgi:general stress protein YciG
MANYTKGVKRGFALLDPEHQRRLASKGGRTAHANGTAHQWTPETAAAAGRKGGQATRTPKPAPTPEVQ